MPPKNSSSEKLLPLQEAPKPAPAHRSKLLLRASHYFVRMFALLAEDLTDTFTQNIFTVNNSAAWQTFANIVLPFFSALIWILMAFQDAITFSYSITSKPKRIFLLASSIIGAVTGVLVVAFSFIGLSIGAIAGASLFIALGAAISAIRSGFYLYLAWRKNTPADLLKDRQTRIEKLKGNSKRTSTDSEKLLRLSLQESALTAVAVSEKTACNWQRYLAKDIQDYQKEKVKEHKIECALTSMVAVGSFLLLAPGIPGMIGGGIIVVTALISLLWASIKFCKKSFNEWDNCRQINRHQIKGVPIRFNNSFNELKKLYLDTLNFKYQEDRDNYWRGLPKSLQHEKCITAIPLMQIGVMPAENRGKLIMLWYCDQLLDYPKKSTGANIVLDILKKSLSFLIKKIFYIALTIPILAVAAVYGIIDSKKIAPNKSDGTLALAEPAYRLTK